MAADLVTSVRAALAEAADPARAPGMQAYMKSAMPYLGVSAVPLRQVCREVFKDLTWNGAKDWHADVLAIWRGAEFREERYAAIELSGVKVADPFQDLSALPMYGEMIVTGAWWDYVDIIAGHRLWAILQAEGEPVKRAMLAWSTDTDMWKRRSAILCQLKAKGGTDLGFLYACIAPSIESKEFFLRKAIGWALRDYARTDPDWVTSFVRDTPLSPLSRREALKHLRR